MRLLLTILILASPIVAFSQAEETGPVSIHWAYSAYFGTGWYTVPGERDVFIIRMTPRWTLSEPAMDEYGARSVGKELKVPVSLGLNQFDPNDLIGAADLDNVSFLSVNPGVDFEIPVNDSWALRPYASVGYGHVLGSGESAVSYWTGVKSRVSFSAKSFDWHLINQLGIVGYTPDDGPSDQFWPGLVGLEFDHPLGHDSEDSSQLVFHWRVAYTAFGKNIVFTRNSMSTQVIDDQWELGAAVGRRGEPLRIWFLRFDRLGLGYRSSSSGDLKGVTFFFRSLFDE
jgi:hypothetical protein